MTPAYTRWPLPPLEEGEDPDLFAWQDGRCAMCGRRVLARLRAEKPDLYRRWLDEARAEIDAGR